MKPFRFEVSIRVEIRKVEPDGYPLERLTIDETLNLLPGTFVEATTILGRFHELAEKIKTEQR